MMIEHLWRWRVSDYEDQSKAKLLDESWITEAHRPTEITADGMFPVPLWTDPALNQIGNTQHTTSGWFKSDDGKRVYRVRQIVRVG